MEYNIAKVIAALEENPGFSYIMEKMGEERDAIEGKLLHQEEMSEVERANLFGRRSEIMGMFHYVDHAKKKIEAKKDE